MSRFLDITESHEVRMDLMSRDTNSDVSWVNEPLVPETGEQTVGLLDGSQCTVLSIFPPKEDDEPTSKISGRMESLHLPTELISFAATYKKAYRFSLFLDCWSRRIHVPLRLRHRSKSKSECLTCKVRRVKCDGGAKNCLRCQKLGLRCGGYYSPPRDSLRRASLTARQAVVPRMVHQSLQSLSIFDNSQEYKYFRIFRSEGFHRQGRHNILLQLFQTETFRRTVLTLATLQKLKGVPHDSRENEERNASQHPQPESLQNGSTTSHHGNETTASEESRKRRTLFLSYLYMLCLKAISTHNHSDLLQAYMNVLFMDYSTNARYLDG